MDSSPSFSKVEMDDDKYVENIRRSIIEHDDEETRNVPICIFSVPKLLVATDPKSYTPQQVALGPFHHWRPELYEMQRYKLAAARRTQKYMNVSFERIVEVTKTRREAKIRACYHKFLDMSGDALVWMMAVDMAFLLEFLQMYYMKQEDSTPDRSVTSSMSCFMDVRGKKLSHVSILSDLVMVENQIPLFLIRKMLEYQIKEPDSYTSSWEQMKMMMLGLYHELSPFHEEDLADVDIHQCTHILHFLYQMTVPDSEDHHIHDDDHAIQIKYEGITEETSDGAQEESSEKPKYVQQAAEAIWKILTKTNAGIIKVLGKPVALVTKLPIPDILKQPVQKMLEKFRGEQHKKSENKGGDQETPTIEEIMIPSVTEMVKARIHISPVIGGISKISFDVRKRTLYLPVVELDVNTEVYLRNLVAYEACVATGPLVMARYTELMNGIIDTEEDVKYLRERGVVVNHLKSDKEAAELWNGMSKSLKLTKVAHMDKVVVDVNKMYEHTWSVKASKYLKKYVFASWKVLTLLAALFMLLLTTVQAFCSVYACNQTFHGIETLIADE